MRKIIEVEPALWRRFEKVAAVQYPVYGSKKKAITRAILDWVETWEGRNESP